MSLYDEILKCLGAGNKIMLGTRASFEENKTYVTLIVEKQYAYDQKFILFDVQKLNEERLTKGISDLTKEQVTEVVG